MSKIIVGSGDFKYEVISNFGSKTSKAKISGVSHVSVDSNNNVYFLQRNGPPVLIFSNEGEFIGEWETDEIVDVHGVYITKNDEIFIGARGMHEVLKYDSKGTILMRIGNRENPSWQKPFNHPADVAISQSGEIFVADGYGNACVHKFSPEGRHLSTWGTPGSARSEFHTPHGIWVDKQDRVYVVDRDNNRIQIFTASGEFISEWTDFFHPMDIYFDENNLIYVTDQTPRFTVLNADGKIQARGFAPDAGHGLWGDSYGNLYLAGHNRGVVKLLKK